MSKILVTIRVKDYIHIVDDKKVKSKKLIARSKKMTVIDYRDSSIYYLYNRKKNEIIFSTSVHLNEKNMLTSSFSNKDFMIDSSESFDEESSDEEPFNKEPSESPDQTDDKISMPVQYVELDHPPVGEFVDMGKQRDAAKKKNKNKRDNNTSSRAGIPSMQ